MARGTSPCHSIRMSWQVARGLGPRARRPSTTGHSSTKMTLDTYAEALPDAKVEAMRRLDALLQ